MNNLLHFRAPRFAIKLNDVAAPYSGDKVPTRVQILRTGEFSDPRYGTFDIKPEHLLAMKQNFESKIRGVQIAIDYSHESDKQAAGWIMGLEISPEGDQLWANPVRWTNTAQKCLAEGEYLYLSADFTFEYEDNETGTKHGPVLLGAGLTNRPVIKEMSPIIELKEGKGKDMSAALEKRCKEMEDKMAEMADKIDTFQKAMDAKKDDDGDEPDADDEAPKGGNGNDEKKGGEGKSAGKKGVMDKQAQQEMADLKAKLASYEAKEKQASEEKALSEKKSKFDKMLSEGKCVEAQRVHFMSGDSEKFMELAQPVKLSSVGHGGSGAEGTSSEGSISAQQEVLNLSEKLASEKKISQSDAISLVLKGNKDLMARYEKETTFHQ